MEVTNRGGKVSVKAHVIEAVSCIYNCRSGGLR